MKKPQRKIDIEQNKYRKKRKNNPSSGLVKNSTDPLYQEERNRYAYDYHLSPELKFDPKRAKIEKIIDNGLSGSEQDAKNALKKLKEIQEPYLNWAGKAEKTSFEVPTVSLHTHEKIDSRAIIEQVRKTNTVDYEQLSLFKKEQKIPKNEAIDFYKHEKGWSNRLIAGDSLLVMNSLIHKEKMAGKVQCIYIDPPYGIKYGSNFQPFTHQRSVADKDKDLTSEPEMLKAFRDTWKLGIHSYLTYMRDRLLLAKELLKESGACFVQISNKNVHLIRNIMDEIFGKENFVSQIYFATTSGFPNEHLSRIGDYLIWYARDKIEMKYHQLFTEKNLRKQGDDFYNNLELFDGTRRPMSKEEKKGSVSLPEGSKIFTYGDLQSSDPAKKDTPFEFKGKIYRPNPNRHWKAKYPEGMERLRRANRIGVVGNNIKYIRFINDKPINDITNLWTDTGSSFQTKRFVVQTNQKVIERCILMTTDPGDLIFDPTCGSGTTAYVAEKWGRRWITCDTSRVAITLAKQRLMTSVFDYYKLKKPDEGVASGFEHEEVPHITLSSISNNEPPNYKKLYDRPTKDNKKKRVTSPFTLEAVPYHVVQDIGIESHNLHLYQFKHEWLEEMKKTGIRGKNGITTDTKFVRLEKLPGFKHLHAEGETSDPRKVIISFGSEYSPLDKRQVESALEELKQSKKRPDILVFAAFHCDPEAQKLIDESNESKFRIIYAQMNMDLQTEDLKKCTSNESFWLIGCPDIKLNFESKQDKYTVEVKGWDYYNSSSGKIESGGSNKIAMWVLDTDYDGRAVFPRQVFFPMASEKEGWSKLAETLKSEIDKDLIEIYKGTTSLPFKIDKYAKIAVKIIDDRGIESLKIIDLAETKILKKVA